MVVNICLIAISLILGVIFSLGKGASLIAGYNTLSSKDKANYDEKALCKFMGKLMFGIVCCMLLWVAHEFYPDYHLYLIGTILLIGMVVGAIFYVNSGSRFKKS